VGGHSDHRWAWQLIYRYVYSHHPRNLCIVLMVVDTGPLAGLADKIRAHIKRVSPLFRQPAERN
jgi:hypothetical protein